MESQALSPPLLFELEPSWYEVLKDELKKPYISPLVAFVARERKGPLPIYPPQDLVFNALWQTPFEKVKVVIVGQDPYHGPNQAHGLSFSVSKGISTPPSLQNIYKELHDDISFHIPKHGCLLEWAQRGVLLLNATLTVRHKEPMSHQGKGWERFTDAILAALSQRDAPLVFLLWGRHAQEKCKTLPNLENNPKFLILRAAHPSPMSAHNGFLGCKHFSKANAFLKNQGIEPINWEISA